jgi:hypothetical protein
MFISSIEKEIERAEMAYSRLLQVRNEEATRALGELDVRHNKKFDALNFKLEKLKQLKQAEFVELRRDKFEVSHKEAGLEPFDPAKFETLNQTHINLKA